MLGLYDIPNWLMGVVIVSITVTLTYAGYFLLQRAWRPSVTDANTSVAMSMLGVIAMVHSLLLAFSAVSVWDSFGSAEEAVVHEANTMGALARDLALFDSADSRQARRMLLAYAELVVNAEWDTMRSGEAHDKTWNAFDRMFLVVGRLEPDTPRRVALLPEILGRANDLLKERRSRLHTSASTVPGTLWAVVLIGTVLTLLTTFVLPPTRFNIFMIGQVSLSIGLVFFLIIAMDRPFAGKESISPAPFELAIDNMRRWESEILEAGTR
jgi:Protein of unknown function (DUF4239)